LVPEERLTCSIDCRRKNCLLNCRKKNLNKWVVVVVSLYFLLMIAIADKQESIRRWLAHEADSVKQGGA
jgi:hypothetical protein